jgi:hypothetical protein
LALCGAIAELKGFAAGIDPFKLIGRWRLPRDGSPVTARRQRKRPAARNVPRASSDSGRITDFCALVAAGGVR